MQTLFYGQRESLGVCPGCCCQLALMPRLMCCCHWCVHSGRTLFFFLSVRHASNFMTCNNALPPKVVAKLDAKCNSVNFNGLMWQRCVCAQYEDNVANDLNCWPNWQTRISRQYCRHIHRISHSLCLYLLLCLFLTITPNSILKNSSNLETL